MGLSNKIICVKPGSGNTATGACVINIARIVGAISIPSGTEIDISTDLAALKTALTSGTMVDDPLLRYYPIPNLVPQADNSGDLQVQTYPDGTVVVTGEGVYDWTFDLLEGKNCLSSRLRQHNGQNEDILLVDAENHLIGQKGSTADMLKGYDPSILFALAPVLSQGQDAVTAYRWRLSFAKGQLADNLSLVDFGTDTFLRSLRGLQDVALNKISRTVAVLKIGASTACGSVNLYNLYKTQLAVVGAWVVKNSAGAVITLSSVAADDNVLGWTLTLDTTDPDYVAGAPVNVSWAGPTELSALLVKGFESNIITVTV
jgi:hypothetical protein